MIDLTNCKKLKKGYSGANGDKICVEYNDEKYMIKFPSLPTKKTELSYANSCISEYISCHIYEMLNIPVQETFLGTYNKNGKTKIVVACKDFVKYGYELQDFVTLKNQIIDSAHQGYGTELKDILEAINNQNIMNGDIIKDRFWSMFIVDALLGNFDRHNGNWGFLYDVQNDDVDLAPVYDCGSCLLPQADKYTIEKILSSQGELNTRIYNFPTSAIKLNGRKINYFDFLTTTDDYNCLSKIVEIFERIDTEKINNFIDNIECIEDIQKSFYKTYLNARCEKILVPSYKRAKLKTNYDGDGYDFEH